MSIWMFLKIAGDIFLYFSVIAAFPSLFDCGMSYFWPVVLCGTGAAIAAAIAGQGRWNLRLLGMILPLSAFALVQGTMDVLVLLPALLYTAAVILGGQFSLEYYNFRATFQRMLKLWGIFFLLIALAHGFEVEAHSRYVLLESAVTFRYGLLWAVCSVVLQRQLRLGEERCATSGKQSAMLAAGSSVVLLGLVGLERLLQSYATSIQEVLGTAMRYLFGMPVAFLGWLFQAVMDLDVETLQRFEEEASIATTEAPELATIPVGTPVEPEPFTTIDVGFPWLLVMLILVVMTGILAGMLRILRRSKASRGAEKEIHKVERPKLSRQTKPRSNRSKVRKLYRAFLKAERKKGMKLHPNQTSLDILNKLPEDTDIDAAKKLRTVYLSARYDETRPVTDDELKTAQNAMKRL